MGDAAGQHPQAFKFLAVQHFAFHHQPLMLCLLASRDVAGDGFDGHGLAAMSSDATADFEHDFMAVAGHDVELLMNWFLASEQAVPPGAEDTPMFWRDPVFKAPAVGFGGRVACNLSARLVQHGEASC